jgi:hypothetical protein
MHRSIRRRPHCRDLHKRSQGGESTAEANAQDAAIVASLALQHGCPLETIQHALVRSGGLGGPLAALLDEVERQSEDWRA